MLKIMRKTTACSWLKSQKILDSVSKFFMCQLMDKRTALKRMLKFTLKQIRHVSVQKPSPGSALFELAKDTVVKIIN
jgi:hypothetical protein